MRLFALLLCCTVFTACSRDDSTVTKESAGDAAPAARRQERTEAQEDFLALELDGRWGWYRREVNEEQAERAWASWLIEQGQTDFLAWLALCRPARFSIYGGTLAAADDVRWVQLAAWTLDSTVPADAAAARELIDARPGLVLDWLESHLSELSPTEDALRKELVAASPEREKAERYEAPLGEGTVYLGLLREARAVREGTATAAPEEEQPSRGDAARAILALTISKRRSPQLLDALADVARHPDATLALAVAEAALRLDSAEVPTLSLLAVLRDDERPMALREEALEAVAHGPRYAAYVEFCKLALSPRHKLWPAAVRELGKFGDGFATSCLSELTDEELDDEQRALRDEALAAIAERGELSEAAFTAQLSDYMERLTYADLAGGLIRDKALEFHALELRERLHSYDLKYQLKTVMVKYQAPERLAIGVDGDLWTARLHEHCADAISY